MKNKLASLLTVAFLSTAFLSSCTPVKDLNNTTVSTSKQTINGKWELKELKTNDGKSLAQHFPQGLPTLNFTAGTMLNGRDGCNNLNGAVSIKENNISFGNIASTMMACQGVSDGLFNSTLKNVTGFAVSGDQLMLKQGDKVLMTFQRPANLEGTWVLEEFIGKDRSAKSLDQRFPNKKPTVTFQDNKVSGNNGCNNLTGAYLAVGSKITMQNIATTRMMCDGVDEGAFNERFNAVNKFEIVDGKLVLYADDVKTMVFGNMRQPR